MRRHLKGLTLWEHDESLGTNPPASATTKATALQMSIHQRHQSAADSQDSTTPQIDNRDQRRKRHIHEREMV
ncbi:hypothetical protein CC1G_14994 [Coprinopsis cinerea okayama7|uniref:Uncharacterized protein n=1 Tax=Coprinopsis cinerea (strain Okayama-7 / 130 / ATCC MYA-4618 / FGSC 9003) TaxID=240176 RepID=D6RP17_COPC7|nr:hypothetical protein CC1G_14994 [Coprinopsis cinerea okayama7\|eukprot:XP_002910663.1 hypothetical protein CC1G_14994 [Coprinopsis cinerea okayama7\